MEIPGFVDLQVNGYKGVDFSSPDLDEEHFLYACKELIKHGTVAFLPTIITSPLSIYKKNLGLIARAMDHQEIKKHILGIHVEGPFISEKEGARGAHNRNWVHKPDIRLLDNLYDWSEGRITLLTMAAEPEGADTLCRHAVSLGITVSLGHHLATESDLEKLVLSGARALTHLGNGLPNMLPRHNNPLWAGLANDDLSAMIISDGHHLPPSFLKTVIRTKGIEKSIVTSDASPVAGLPPGRYHTLGNDVLLEPSGLLHNPEAGHMVGSSATMLECINHLLSLKLVTKKEAFAIGFYNPLNIINTEPSTIRESLPSLLEWNGSFDVSGRED